MFHPKNFYRELDRLLNEIDAGRTDTASFQRLIEEIQERFGSALRVQGAELYTEMSGLFAADRSRSRAGHAVSDFRADDPRTGLVIAHGVFIFDHRVTERLGVPDPLGGEESAALLIDSRPRRIVAFQLRSDWDRSELDFALNTIRNAINHRLELLHLTTAMQQATEIQRSLLPTTPPRFPGFDVSARSIAAASVGGDFYDFLPMGEDLLGIAVGDASGHGLGAALLARDVVTGLRMGVEKDLKIAAVIDRLNRVIQRSGLSTRFASLFFGELESNGNLFYVNAGHPPAWVFGEKGVRRLQVGGAILGPLEGTRFKRGFAHIDRGDTLVILTDGLLERRNHSGDLYDDRRVELLMERLAGAGAGRIIESIFEEVADYGGHAPWVDDSTAVVIVRHADAPPKSVDSGAREENAPAAAAPSVVLL